MDVEKLGIKYLPIVKGGDVLFEIVAAGALRASLRDKVKFVGSSIGWCDDDDDDGGGDDDDLSHNPLLLNIIYSLSLSSPSPGEIGGLVQGIGSNFKV